MIQFHISGNVKPPEGPTIGVLTGRLIDGTLHLFDKDGRRLDFVSAIQLNQSPDTITTATVTIVIDMERK